MAVLKLIGNTGLRRTEYTEVYNVLTDEKGQGQEGMVGDLCELAVIIEDWYDANIVDSVELTDGVYMYEFVEMIAGFVVGYAKDHSILPPETAMIAKLENVRQERKQAVKQKLSVQW